MSGSQLSEITAIPQADLLLVQNALGVDLLGTFCGLILYGIIVRQFYVYMRSFNSDAVFIRVLIVSVVILETMHMALTMHYPYVFLVTNFGNPIALAVGTWSVNINPIFAALITVFSQMFFIGRIYIIGFRYRMVAVISALLLVPKIPLAIYTADSLFMNGIRDDIMQEKRLIETSLALPAIVDTFLSLTLIHVIRRSRASLKRSDHISDLIVTYGINTGLLHWILNWGAFISFVAVKNPFTSEQYGAITIVAARVYAITFLCVLNSRSTKTSEAIFDSGSYGLKVIERTNQRAAAERWNVPHIPEEPAPINISVTRELEEGGDWDGPRKHHGETSSTDLDSTF